MRAASRLLILHSDGLEAPSASQESTVTRRVGLAVVAEVRPGRDHERPQRADRRRPADEARRVLDRSEHSPIFGFDFSPDGKWIAYAWAPTLHTSIIKLCGSRTARRFHVTRPVLQDISPGVRSGRQVPLLPLAPRVRSGVRRAALRPGLPQGHAAVPRDAAEGSAVAVLHSSRSRRRRRRKRRRKGSGDEKGRTAGREPPFRIDPDGIEDRVVAFPVPEAIYQQIDGDQGQGAVDHVPVEGSLKQTWIPGGEPPAKATLEVFDFETVKAETLVKDISNFKLSRDRQDARLPRRQRSCASSRPARSPTTSRQGAARTEERLDRPRSACASSVEPPPSGGRCTAKRGGSSASSSGSRTWPTSTGRRCTSAIAPLLDRVATRNEFSDLLWEMQGELGSSHAYAIGGDVREEPNVRRRLPRRELRVGRQGERRGRSRRSSAATPGTRRRARRCCARA